MAVKIQTIKDIRFYITQELNEVYNEPEIRVLSDILIKTVTGVTKLHDLYDNNYTIAATDAERIAEMTHELKTGKPIQYIVGETTFYNCTIRVNSSTLIPRSETEELVDLILRENKEYAGNIIDFGTGSGCIAIALAANLPLARLTGIDISESALEVARENGKLNKVNVSFIKGDIFNFNHALVSKAGIIVSNPPYVRSSEKAAMDNNVLDFEPHSALFVKDSAPLEFYSAILTLAEMLLLPGGTVYFEINEAMGIQMKNLMESFSYAETEIIPDLNGKDRIIKGRKNE